MRSRASSHTVSVESRVRGGLCVGRQFWSYADTVESGIGAWFPSFRARGEPWDSLWYIFLGMPMVYAVKAGLSYTDARRPWRWGAFR